MKRVKQLVPLSHEHHHGLVLAQKALRLNETAELRNIQTAWQGVKAYFQGPARQHFLIEEHYLLEPLSVFEDYKTLMGKIYDEHQQFLAFASEPVGSLASITKHSRLIKKPYKMRRAAVV